jgi:hypothetical protein
LKERYRRETDKRDGGKEKERKRKRKEGQRGETEDQR